MIAHFAICPRGLEPALADELTSLGASAVQPTAGGVGFDADAALAYRVNLQSRLASRVLRQLGQARYRNDDDLYKLAARTPWETLFGPEQTLRVDVNAHRANVRSLNFATLRIKDGIVDRLRQHTGERPSIDTRTPDVRVFGFLDERTLTLYVDLSGEPLFKRGWRDDSSDDDEGARKGAAPLKEHLAAGLLALSGWTPAQPLYDPFCGSGTIVVEAAQRALGLAPGRARRFGFEALRDFDAGLWKQVRGEAADAAATAADTPLRLAASDIDGQALAQTRRNLRRAGVSDAQIATMHLKQCDFANARPPFDEPGLVLCNPPYGERIGVRGDPEGGADMGRFASHLKQHFRGWKIAMLTADLTLPRQLGMKERRKTPLHNGPLECRLFVFEIFDR